MVENLERYRNKSIANIQKNLFLNPIDLSDMYLLEGLEIMFEEGLRNKTIFPGSPKVDGRSVSVQNWLEYSVTDPKNIYKIIYAQFETDGPLVAAGHITLSELFPKIGKYEERIYIYRREHRSQGLADCALDLFFSSLKGYEVASLVAFVHSTNLPSVNLHWAFYGEPKRKWGSKEVNIRVFERNLIQ